MLLVIIVLFKLMVVGYGLVLLYLNSYVSLCQVTCSITVPSFLVQQPIFNSLFRLSLFCLFFA